MAEEQQYWLAHRGERLGPYREAVVRQLLANGKVDGSTLAWREGMSEWLPLSQVLGVAPGSPPRGPGASDPYGNAPTYARGHREVAGDAGSRRQLPEPPSLHWFLVILFTMLTVGIFGIVWPFIQAAWVRRIDPSSKARVWLGVSLACTLTSWIVQFAFLGRNILNPGLVPLSIMAGWSLLAFVVSLVNLVFYYMAVYAMAGSIRRAMPAYGLRPEIGGITLFFFSTIYLQGQLTWIDRWKRTGSDEPRPPKTIFWVLWLVFPVGFVAVLAAIAIPQYQNYTVRAQVTEGMTVSQSARQAVATYYASHHALPADNAAAGLPAAEDVQGRYVSGVRVDHGRVDVSYGTGATTPRLRGKTLVLTPYENNGEIGWRCTEGSDIAPQELPLSCRH